MKASQQDFPVSVAVCVWAH